MRRFLPWASFAVVPVGLIWLVIWMFGLWQTWPGQLAAISAQAKDLKPSLAVLGQVGDSYGALNAAVGGLAFLGVLVTILLQLFSAHDQNVQKHEEQFESRFFQLLELGRSLRSEVQFTHGGAFQKAHPAASAHDKRTGFAAFQAMHEELAWHLKDWKAHGDPQVDRRALGTTYRSIVHDHSETTISPYFRILYTILRRIDEDDLLSKPKKHAYSNLVRSQITSAELSVASLNGLVAESANFSSYLEKARMFKYMPQSAVKSAIRRHYWFAAFLGRDECSIENPPHKEKKSPRPASSAPWLEHAGV